LGALTSLNSFTRIRAYGQNETMGFEVRLTTSAIEDLQFFDRRERRIISNAIALYLGHDANIEARRRKPLGPNRTAIGKSTDEDRQAIPQAG